MKASQAMLLFLATVSLLVSAPMAAVQPRVELSPEQEEFVEALQVLTYPEIDQILLEIQEFQLEDPSVSEEDLARLAISLVKQQVLKPLAQEDPLSEDVRHKTYLPDKVYRLNASEKAICALYPKECVIMYSCSSRAETTAPRYFSDGCEDGRCDAFRHAYWNALMVRRINRSFARNFAAAHEKESKGLPKEMDTYNNGKGQSIGEDYTTRYFTETQVEKAVSLYVRDGRLRIIKNGRLVSSNQ